MMFSLFLLWLEGVSPARLEGVPAVARLIANGADVRLTPLPLPEKSMCYYQVMTGMGSGKIGRYDAVRPVDYMAYEESSVPDGAFGRCLPDILRVRKLTSTLLETNDVGRVAELASQRQDCTMVRFACENATVEEIDGLIQQCQRLAGPEAALLLLTDVWSGTPSALVNVNDFLADIGLIEVGEARSRAVVNWSESLAYGLGAGQVWVNLSGREPQGIVGSGEEYEEVREALINELNANWLDPQTNSPVLEQVLKKEEAYSGDYIFNAPDLSLVFRPGYAPSTKAVALDFDGQSVTRVDGAHEQEAAGPYARLIAAGPRVSSGVKDAGSLVDVLPSVLYLLEQPAPEHVDGRVMTAMCAADFVERHPVQYFDFNEASEEEEGVIVDRLRDLGYLG